MAARAYPLVFLALAGLGFTADQVSKYHVFRWLYGHGVGDRYVVIPGVFELLSQFKDGDGHKETGVGLMADLRTWGGEVMPRVNQGALFGFKLGLEDSATAANLVFTGVSIVAALAIFYWGTRRLTSKDGLLCVALGLILGGTLGNLYDRVVFGGVRDFLHFYWFEWPVFNVADCCLVTGAGLLLLQAFLAKPAAEADRPPVAAAAAEVARVP
jgi:lipoprotein signal peptidase